MRVLSLLFDPRGAIDRRAFWSGLIQLMIVSLAVYAGLTLVDGGVASAALPAIGDAFVAIEAASHARSGALPSISLMAGVFLVVARFYVTACLMLKRLRDAGRGSRAVVSVGLAVLVVHVLTGLSIYDLFPEGIALIVPLIADAMATAALGLIFTVWLGALPSSSANKPARAWRSPQVKPAS